MPKTKTEVEKAAGKLVSAIQKEWGHEMGEAEGDESEKVMYLAHDFLQAGEPARVLELLAGRSIQEYLGDEWVRKHKAVQPFVDSLDEVIAKGNA